MRGGAEPEILGKAVPGVEVQKLPGGVQRILEIPLHKAGVLQGQGGETVENGKCPCYGCGNRKERCHEKCGAYREYRAVMDRVREQRNREQRIRDAGFVRGDKIREDARKNGYFGQRREKR